jgi:hypothetical protein
VRKIKHILRTKEAIKMIQRCSKRFLKRKGGLERIMQLKNRNLLTVLTNSVQPRSDAAAGLIIVDYLRQRHQERVILAEYD